MSLRELFHIIVVGDQKRVVRFGGYANQIVVGPACDDILERDQRVTVLDERESDGGRHALVKEDAKLRRPRALCRRWLRGCPLP